MKIIENITDSLLYEKQFNKNQNSIELVRFNANYDKVYAIHNKEDNTLRFFKELNLKKNDKLIDKHDNLYFVEEVILNQPFKVIGITKQEKEFNTVIVKYAKKEIEMPDSLKQCVSINTNINIDANNSTFNGGLANYNISQTATYTQMFDFMKVLCNNTFNVKELQPFLQGIQVCMKEKKSVDEKWYNKFFKFMGTQLLDIAKQFLVAYTTAIITK